MYMYCWPTREMILQESTVQEYCCNVNDGGAGDLDS